MTVMLDRARPAAEAGVKADGKLADPDPEAPQRAHRRTSTAQYKLEVMSAITAIPARPLATMPTCPELVP